ncbi:MAG: hypothetical protein ACREL9_03425 [Gemmatimonadales bacterium]
MRPAACLILGLGCAPAAAQQPTLPPTCVPRPETSEWELARRYAPILRFAPGERFFPTIPFFSAFDGAENGGDPSHVDFEDVVEIAPRDAQGRVSWDRLHAAYERRHGSPYELAAAVAWPPEKSAVFFRVRDLSTRDERLLRNYLLSDEQAWPRLRHLEPDSVFKQFDFRVVEYYLYYVNDKGLEGHPEDIEFVFVFLPFVRRAGHEELWDGCFRMVVGGGHTYRVPNNVLVLGENNMPPETNPSVLVELGGHSSAPDLPADGRFLPGLDVNWHVYNVWGTRDIQAVAGVGFGGPYRVDMSFPRDTAAAVVLYPPQLAAAESMEYQRIAAQQGVPGAAPAPVMPKANRYALLPVVLFDTLARAVEGRADVPDTASVRRLIAELQRLLPLNWGFRGLDGLSDSAFSLAVRQMREWNASVWSAGYEIESRRHQIWRHEQYRNSPTWILKRHLFRPTFVTFSVRRPWQWYRFLTLGRPTYGLSWLPDEAFVAHLGVILPAIPLPTRFPGFVELQAGRYGRDWFGGEHQLALALLWDHHYNERFSWYLKLAHVSHRADVGLDPEARDLTFGGGISALLLLGRKRTFFGTLANALRVRAGLRTEVKPRGGAFTRTAWELQLSFRQ